MTEEEVDRARFLELVRQDEMSPSTEFIYAFEWLQTAHEVLDGNYEELKAILDLLDRDPPLPALNNRERQDRLHRLYIRRLHNYLASVYTLIENTRTFRRRHVVDTGFDRAYDARLSELDAREVMAFMEDLGNSVRHAAMARVSITTTFPQGRMLRRQMTLQASQLLSTDDWTQPSRAYIARAQEGYNENSRYLDLSAAAAEYQSHVSTFYDWFYEAVHQLKRASFEEFDTRRNELAALQHRAAIPAEGHHVQHRTAVTGNT